MHYKSKKLLSLFIASSVVGLLVIWIAIYFGIRVVYQEHVIDIARQQSVSIGRALFIQEGDMLVDGDLDTADNLSVSPSSFARLDQRMHDYLAPFAIVKIKVFNRQSQIVYSTDESIIGKTDADNPRLIAALNGSIDSELETKEKFVDLKDEERIDIDVVETYIPVRNHSDAIIGSMEVYMDVTRYRERLKDTLVASMAIIAAILVVTFSALFIIMRRGTRQLGEYELQLHAMAVTDELTGISNRRFLLDRAEEEFARVQREKMQVHPSVDIGCILIDVDHFKKINDGYGHHIGDIILQELANRMVHAVRRYDIVGRYGGEEFLILMPHADGEQVREIAERIRLEVRGRPFEVDDLQLNVTVSIGYACIDDEDVVINDVIKRADDGLYRAKANGRDQIASICSRADRQRQLAS